MSRTKQLSQSAYYFRLLDNKKSEVLFLQNVAPSLAFSYKAAQTATVLSEEVKPSPGPPAHGISLGSLLHIGHSLLRTVEERIQIIKLILSPDWIGNAPCMCCPRWRSPKLGLCSYCVHSASFKGTCKFTQWF